MFEVYAGVGVDGDTLARGTWHQIPFSGDGTVRGRKAENAGSPVNKSDNVMQAGSEPARQQTKILRDGIRGCA